jgi:RecA-family ATPase
MLKASSERLQAGETVLYVDYEDSAPSIVHRLLSLGLAPDTIRHGFAYIRPDEALGDATLPDLDKALQAEPSIAVIDGLTEAFSQQGLSPLDNSDVAQWLELLPRTIVRTGTSVVLLDHVVKDREQRGRYALGAGHNLAGVDVAYSMRVLEPFGRGRDGVTHRDPTVTQSRYGDRDPVTPPLTGSRSHGGLR